MAIFIVNDKLPPANASLAEAPLVRVWLVDDDKFFRGQCALLLQMEGGIVCDQQFFSVEELLAALKQMTGPDVILLDHHLSGMNGLDAIPQIKSLSPATAVYMFSAQFTPHQEIEARAHGANDIFSKYDFDYVLKAIRSRSSNNPVKQGS
jgi:CheY-like chemotaxis protein